MTVSSSSRSTTNPLVLLLPLFKLLTAGGVSAFTIPQPQARSSRVIQVSRDVKLFGIRCENKYYQLEEMEDKENSTTELFLKEDGSVLMGKTDGPLFSKATGTWQVKPGTDDFIMTINKQFNTGSSGRDMGEFDYTVSRTFEGEMTHVGESVAITGVMKSGPLGETQDVGFFNMIDGTDIRLDARSDARPGVKGEKDPTLVASKNDATSTHKGAEGYYVGQPQGTSMNAMSNLPQGWEEFYDHAQQRHYYVETATGVSQWERPTNEQAKLQQQALSTFGQSQFARQSQQQMQQQQAQLPTGWEEHYDPAQQKPYYVNTYTGSTQWDRPQQ